MTDQQRLYAIRQRTAAGIVDLTTVLDDIACLLRCIEDAQRRYYELRTMYEMGA